MAYILAGAQQLDEQQPFRATIELSGETQDLEAVVITVANAAPATSVMVPGIRQCHPRRWPAGCDHRPPRKGGLKGCVCFPLSQDRHWHAPQLTTTICFTLRNGSLLRIHIDPPQGLVVDG